MSKHTKTQNAIRDLAEAEAESLGITIKAFLMSLFPAIWADESKAAPAKKEKAAPVEEAEEAEDGEDFIPEEFIDPEEEQEEDSDEDEDSEDDDILPGKKSAPAKKKVAKKKAAKKQKATEEEAPPAKSDKGDKVTLEKVRNTMLQAMQTDGIGPQPVKKVLVDHGAQKVSDLGEDDYASVVEALQALIEAADEE